MGSAGPLGHPELRVIERLLDANDVVEAQRRLADLREANEFADGIAYLTTRLLYLRGRLDMRGVADRLRELLAKAEAFPEARAFLEEAEHGVLNTLPPAPPSLQQAAVRGPTSSQRQRASKPDPEAVTKTDPHATAALDTEASRKAAWPPMSAFPGFPNEPSKPAPIPTAPVAAREQSAPATSVAKGKSVPGPRIRSRRAATEVNVEENDNPRPRSRPPSEAPQDRASRGSHPPSVKPQKRRFTPITGLEAISEWQPSVRERTDGERREPPIPRSIIPAIPRAPAIPQFRDNDAPPSYAPEDKENDRDPIHTKSLLPLGAGRYSESPQSTDVVKARRRAPRNPIRRGTAPPAPASARPRGPRPVAPSMPQGAAARNSPSDVPPLPTLFEIGSWVDEGRFRDAIAAVNRAGPDASPEYAVLRARALAGAGYADQAFDALERLDAFGLLEAELRASCARLFVELGDPARALKSAKQALDTDPDRPLVCLTYALAAVRTARRKPDDMLLQNAQRTLARLEGREGPLPAAFQALKACVQAGVGDPERAISMAQRALGLDPKSPDALAAVAEACARLGRIHEARQAWTKLREISVDEAEALAPLLAQAGVSAKDPRSPAGAERPPLWSTPELDLVEGKRLEAIQAVEEVANSMVGRVSRSTAESGFTAIATVASTFLTLSPVFSSFAPFDLSLFGLRRLESALDVLYGRERRPRLPSDDAKIVLLLGSYVGETLRLARSGFWEGGLGELEAARVVTDSESWHPFRIVKARLQAGRRATLRDALSNVLVKPGTEPWRTRLANPVAPPVPWAPAAWPRPSEVASIGRSLPRSPVGLYCAEFAEGALDRSTASLIALDSYLDLVAPRAATPDPDAAWTRRVAILAGGYVGETVRELIGGDWVYGVDSADDALGFRLMLRGTVQATPVAHVLERVIGARSSTLVDYAKTLMRRAGRS
ncbi:MAG TPA: tetratricopeptide repeat protein [Polyangiaceae bacterium]|jgi:tetratricopeptide (TPR) repeat protein|nr:tetratricopeptide repeat protein [Polyangiaceae bacterium]